ncbi:MAG: shikimate kinase, partial [Nitrospinota bacterium]|nr:shikimate kinase [Nitrospinota bacterium]
MVNLILVGPKACGKSTVGRIAARSLGAPFRDSDEVLEDVHRERTGERKTFREIFRERGEECFRDLEREALERCLRDGDGDRVVALGGGTPVRLAGDASLEGSGFIVYLDLPEEILWE